MEARDRAREILEADWRSGKIPESYACGNQVEGKKRWRIEQINEEIRQAEARGMEKAAIISENAIPYPSVPIMGEAMKVCSIEIAKAIRAKIATSYPNKPNQNT